MGEFSEERSDSVQETGGGETDAADLGLQTLPQHHDQQQTQDDQPD